MKNPVDTALIELQAIHRRVAPKIDMSQKDERLALYILTGRILTSCEALSVLFKLGFITDANIILRSVYEAIWLAEHLYHSNDEISLEKWYAGEIVQPKKSRKAMVELPGFKDDPTMSEKIIELSDDMYSFSSKFAHPTITSSLINMKKKNRLFDYKCESLRGIRFSYPESFSLEQTIVSVISMFLSAHGFFDLDDSKYMELQTLKTILNTF